MDKEEKIQELFGTEVLTYIKNKNRGGSSNAKGNTYENYFAIYQLSLIAKEVIEEKIKVNIYRQTLEFVDDLIIEKITENLRYHYQLKNTEALNWGSGVKSICDDFYKQYVLNISLSKQSQITLVVADLTLKHKMMTSLPHEISEFTEVIYFPYILSINKLIKECTDFQKAIEYLSAFNKPEPDKIEAVVRILIGTWVSNDKEEISVMEILEIAQKTQPSFIRSFSTDLQIKQELQEIFNRIPNFSYNLSRGFLEWKYSNGVMEGTLPYSIDTENFQRLQELIIREKPTEFEQIEAFLI